MTTPSRCRAALPPALLQAEMTARQAAEEEERRKRDAEAAALDLVLNRKAKGAKSKGKAVDPPRAKLSFGFKK